MVTLYILVPPGDANGSVHFTTDGRDIGSSIDGGGHFCKEDSRYIYSAAFKLSPSESRTIKAVFVNRLRLDMCVIQTSNTVGYKTSGLLYDCSIYVIVQSTLNDYILLNNV